MTREVVVVGAGLVGAATARALTERGDRVVLVEQFERGHDRGSSHGETRIFRRG
ncbi:FAD-dependent oxidoreductase [Rathayibacter sp. AY1C5]